MTARKPPELKVITGTLRKDREPKKGVDFPILSDVPPPPDWLPNAHAVEEWNRLAGILTANKTLSEAYLSALGHLCALHGKIVQLVAAGEVPTASMLGVLRNMKNDFGLTPISQSKVKPADSPGRGNRFENNGKKPPRG